MAAATAVDLANAMASEPSVMYVMHYDMYNICICMHTNNICIHTHSIECIERGTVSGSSRIIAMC